ncbi:hydroxylamine reductase [Methanocorpusculum parvum]|uniref:Hydroxylamine reductase n=1 Tax=Methanocorpusculum parvum TaxID=2193 RepID=A0AAX0Q4M3_9EURY|nr:hydroxylamine reductase [Methanocorpusculum parvum]PAV08484.1 hydroxylamine reductase [Methanocorpusculum parvum]
MFCQQCEETARNLGCTAGGVCGKSNDTACYQDAVNFVLSGIAYRRIHQPKGAKIPANTSAQDTFVVEALFATLTNVNFDESRFDAYLKKAIAYRDAYPQIPGEPKACSWVPKSREDIIILDGGIGLLSIEDPNERSLFSLLLFALKGMCAYYSHAEVLGKTDPAIVNFIYKGLASRFEKHSFGERAALVMESGKVGAQVLALLDSANKRYGVTEITNVNCGVGKNPGILVTGHDLKDLYMLLRQTEGKGVDVYTHGEMLIAHAHPCFKKFPHLIGNYGTSWANQKAEFPSFNGPILFTTNCLVPPPDTYKGRIYTTGSVGFPNAVHIPEKPDGSKDFSSIIACAKKCDPPKDLECGDLVTGAGHDAVLALAPKVLDLVKRGKIKHFVVMAGCDGRHKERAYYTEFAKALPKDVIILTAGCAKYRYNRLGLGDIEGIPRVLDAGQCNDSYSLVVIAQELAKALGVEVGELPLSFNIAWYEQKAILVFLVLLALGIKNIMIGPNLPACLSPDVLNMLVKEFGVQPNTTVPEDMKKLGITR